MKKCINCGYELEDDAKFCMECGAKQTVSKKHCAQCGAELLPNARFCGDCGTPIGQDTQPALSESKTAKQRLEEALAAQAVREAEKARIKAEQEAEAARIKAEQEAEKARIKAEQEAKRRAEEAEAARIKAEQEAKRRAEEAEKARIKAEKEAKRRAEEAEAARIKAEQEAKRRAEEAEAARIKAEQKAEKARIKAEQEAKRRAEEAEAARIKAEQEAEEARIKAEQEAKRRAEEAKKARIKAEQEAKRRAEQKAQREARLAQLSQQESKLRKELDEKQRIASDLEAEANAEQNKLAEALATADECQREAQAIENRYAVYLTKRVKSGFFNRKGEAFDNEVIELTGADTDQLKAWYKELSDTGKVAIAENLAQVDASSVKSKIEEAGGEAEVESVISQTEAESRIAQCAEKLKDAEMQRTAAENRIARLKPQLEEYRAAKMQVQKCRYEIMRLKDWKTSLLDFVDKHFDDENAEALQALYPKDYQECIKRRQRQKEEEARRAAEEARRAEKERIEAEERRLAKEKEEEARRAEERKQQELREMRERVKGVVRYTPGDDVEKAYLTIYGSDAITVPAADPDEEWKDYLTDFYWNKHPVMYMLVGDTLVIKCNGAMPDAETDIHREGKNIWHVVKDITVDMRWSIKHIVFTGKVDNIGANCFREFPKVESIVIPPSVKSIGEEAFAGDVVAGDVCSELRIVLVPKNAKVADNAFSKCPKLNPKL